MRSMLTVHTQCGQCSEARCAVDCGRRMVLGTIGVPKEQRISVIGVARSGDCFVFGGSPSNTKALARPPARE